MRRRAIIKDCTEKQRGHGMKDLGHPRAEVEKCLVSKNDPSDVLGYHATEEEAKEQEMAIKSEQGAKAASFKSRLAALSDANRTQIFDQGWIQGGIKKIVSILTKSGIEGGELASNVDRIFHDTWDGVFRHVDAMLQKKLGIDTEAQSDNTALLVALGNLSMTVTAEAIFDTFKIEEQPLKDETRRAAIEDLQNLFDVIGKDPPPDMSEAIDNLVEIGLEAGSKFLGELVDDLFPADEEPAEDIELGDEDIEEVAPERAKASDVLPKGAEWGDMQPQHSDSMPSYYLSPVKRSNSPLYASVRRADELLRSDIDTLFETSVSPT